MSDNISIVCIGHITKDDIVFHTGRTCFNQLGGDSLYSALGAWLWDREGVCILSRRGKNIGDDIVDEFTKRGFITSYIKKDEEHNSPQSWQIFDRFSNRYTVTNPESGKREIVTPDKNDVTGEILKASGYHIAPLCPIEIVDGIVDALPEGAAIVCDPQPAWSEPQYLDRIGHIFSKIDVFMPSENELVGLFGIKPQEDYRNYVDYLVKLHELGAKNVILKIGANGSMIFDGQNNTCHRISAVKVNFANAMGAGDSFCGGFIANYSKTRNLLESAIKASVSSSFIVESDLMQECLAVKYEDVENRYKEYLSYIEIEKLL